MKKLILSLLLIPFFAGAIESGQRAPDFTLKGVDGKAYKLSQFKGKVVVLEWFNPDCPFVHKFYDSKTMQGLQKDAIVSGAVWFTINSSAPGKEGNMTAASGSQIFKDQGMNSTALLLDEKSAVAKLYSAKTTPHMFVIDKTGKLAYQGALDDRPSAQPSSLDGAQNYVTTALAALAGGQPIKTASSTPYGCSVKY